MSLFQSESPRIRIIGFLLAGLWVLAAPLPAATPARPNVLFIAVDDLNHWVGHLGRNPQTKTPNIDRLASMGVAFRHAYCAVPACEPARGALLGGRRPWSTGLYYNGDKWKTILPEGQGLTMPFLKAGYRVSGAGKIYHGDQYFPSEWSEYMDSKGLSAQGAGVDKNEGFHDPLKHDLKDEDLMDWHTVNYAIDRLKRAAADQPFFIACGLHKPHLPFAVPRKYYEQFPLETIQLPPYKKDDLADVPAGGRQMAKANGDHAQFVRDGNWKNAIQSYLAAIAYTDMNIGRLLDAFDRSPQRDNTIIVFWGDHGWSLGEKDHWRKFALWEEPTRAPFIVVAPGVTKPGGVSDRTVDFMSIYPTLCGLAGLPVPKHVEGENITALLRDPKAAWDKPAITTHGFKNHTVRTEQFRYIRYADGGEELYDEVKDPYEWTNLALKPEFAATKATLAKWLPEKNAPHTGAGRAGESDDDPSPAKKIKKKAAK
ncbi:MAG: iduronate-2-sulfatase [Opitutus sp.]|nr:iduronate-2-sulfatase [Opitutus sp.]